MTLLEKSIPDENVQHFTSRMVFSLTTLADLGESITSANDFGKIIKSSLYMILGATSALRGAILRYNPQTSSLSPMVCKGLDLEGGEDFRLPPEEARFLESCQETIDCALLPKTLLSLADYIREDLEARFWIPLRISNQLLGILSLGEPLGGGAYPDHIKKVAKTMAQHVAVAIHNHHLFEEIKEINRQLRQQVEENKRLYENLEAIYNDTIRALGTAIDAKDPYTRGHSGRVARYSVAVAKSFSMTEEEIKAVEVASYLHDIGKITIDSSILRKPSELSKEERQEISLHPSISYDILSKIRFPYPGVALLARHHHERYDGKGYPDRKNGVDLPLGVRIISLMDAFDAMTSDRPYRRGMSLDEALIEIRHFIREQFDPQVAKVFFESLKEELSHPSPQKEMFSAISSKVEPEALLNFLDDVITELS